MTTITEPDSKEPSYGGFGIRLGAYLLDALIYAPVSVLIAWLAGHYRTAYYVSLIPTFALAIFFHVYCVKRWGGTPGKLICGLRIVRSDLGRSEWKEAWLRYSVLLALGIVSTAVYVYALTQIPDAEFGRLRFVERSKRIVELGGVAQTVVTWLTQIWVWSEFVVLLTNRRRRALHDFIAGTVVVRAR